MSRKKKKRELFVAGVLLDEDGEFIIRFVNPDALKKEGLTKKENKEFWSHIFELFGKLKEEIKERIWKKVVKIRKNLLKLCFLLGIDIFMVLLTFGLIILVVRDLIFSYSFLPIFAPLLFMVYLLFNIFVWVKAVIVDLLLIKQELGGGFDGRG